MRGRPAFTAEKQNQVGKVTNTRQSPIKLTVAHFHVVVMLAGTENATDARSWLLIENSSEIQSASGEERPLVVISTLLNR